MISSLFRATWQKEGDSRPLLVGCAIPESSMSREATGQQASAERYRQALRERIY